MPDSQHLQRNRTKKTGLINKFGRLLLDSGTQAIFLHRLAHFFFKKKIPVFPAIIRRTNLFLTGADISHSCYMGRNVLIIHSVGVVIADQTVIGDHCEIFGQVILGGRGGNQLKDGAPLIKNNTVLCIGSKVLGNITIGKNVTIAAGAIVLSNIPDNTLAAGIPATVKKNYHHET